MEQSKPLLQHRSASFNPEAASFSPLNPKETTDAAALCPAKPQEHFEVFKSKLSTLLEDTGAQQTTEDPRVAEAIGSPHHAHGGVSVFAAPNSLQDILNRNMQLGAPRSLQRGEYEVCFDSKFSLLTTAENDTGHEHVSRTISLQNPRTSAYDIGSQATQTPPPFPVQSHAADPVLRTVDVHELSATLGLPAPSGRVTNDESLTRLNRSRPSRKDSDALYGKLMGRALGQPLTADTLAQYLNDNKGNPQDHLAAVTHQYSAPATDLATPVHRRIGQIKVVDPPPAFESDLAHMISPEQRTTEAPTTLQEQRVTTGPTALYHSLPLRPPVNSSHVQHHPRHPSDRKRPRAYTRTKRTDQGPEPSAADIYPEDAILEPLQQRHFGDESMQYHPTLAPYSSPRRHLYVSDATSWPTPAEVYTPKPDMPSFDVLEQHVHPTVMHIRGPDNAPPFDMFEQHTQPTPSDVHEACVEVTGMINELTSISLDTILNVREDDLTCDWRPLTPGQLDGSRFGIRYYGLGLGDDWICPDAREGMPFRVRPRSQEGWGGWDWAIQRGWGQE
jgi:hypothetical protein